MAAPKGKSRAKKVTEPAQAPVASTQPDPQITFVDIQNIEKIINIASTRGAFRANELTQVGLVYDKLTQFLAFWTAKLNEGKDTETTQENNKNG